MPKNKKYFLIVIVILIILIYLLRVFIFNLNFITYFVGGENKSIDTRIQSLANTADYALNSDSRGSLSPDGKWIAYKIFLDGVAGTVFYNVVDHQKTIFTATDIINTAQSTGKAKNSFLDQIRNEDYFHFQFPISSWTSDSKELYMDTESPVDFLGDKGGYPVVDVSTSKPKITFENVVASPADAGTYTNWIQETKKLTCSDCGTRLDFVNRFKKIENNLPQSIVAKFEQDYGTLKTVSNIDIFSYPYIALNQTSFVISSEGTVYWPQQNKMDLDIIQYNSGVSQTIAHFSVHDAGNSTPDYMKGIIISPDDKKIVVSVSDDHGIENFLNHDEDYLIDLSGSTPKIDFLGYNIGGGEFWNKDSSILYLSCSNKTGTYQKDDKLCQLKLD